ncbi:hypothetical protein ACFOW1_09765 [Parasediminibacterium paludis]|uniref:Uncharacterized protein n=1 Tax=Parasediminibacterium paludis TaxID=908966 RepID=A0ABV8PYF3_9BACT
MIYLSIISFFILFVIIGNFFNNGINTMTVAIQTKWLRITLKAILKIVTLCALAIGFITMIILTVVVNTDTSDKKRK